MYYPYNRQQNMKLYKLIIIICAVLFFVSYQSPCFSVDFSEQAQEYREEGYKAQQRGDIQKAISFYTKAISLNPESADAYNDLGVVYETIGELDLAEHNYLKAISLDSFYLPTYSNLAYLYEKTGEIKKAAFYWRKRVKLGLVDDPWTRKAQDNFDSLLDMSKELRRMFLHLEVEKLEIEIERQKLELFMKNEAKAIEYLEKGKEYYKEEMYSQAKEQFQKALSLTPENPAVLDYYKKAEKKEIDEKLKLRIRHGLNYYELGDTDAAREEFKDILSVIPDKSNQ